MQAARQALTAADTRAGFVQIASRFQSKGHPQMQTINGKTWRNRPGPQRERGQWSPADCANELGESDGDSFATT